MAGSAAFKLDRHATIAVQIGDHLRGQILRLELVPGTQLSRQELQARYGLSQTPVRDALQKLADDGLVDIFPQYATFVSRIDLDFALQTHTMRRAVEQEAARILALLPTPDLVPRLKSVNDRMGALVDSGRYVDFAALDREFHTVLYEEAGLADVLPIIQRSSGHLDRLRWLNLPYVGMPHVVSQHDQIILALGSGDAAQAENAIRRHLMTTREMMTPTVERYPDYFTLGQRDD